jgi:hypothetical protein
MPHIDFNYPALGEAYRVFSQKHARLLTVREKLEQPIADRVRQTEEYLRAQRESPAPGELEAHSLSGEAGDEAIGIVRLLDQNREWDSRVLRTVREMVLTYAVVMLDAFLGRWRQENGLPASPTPDGPRWLSAIQDNIDKTLQELRERTPSTPRLALRTDAAARLRAIRTQRNAVVHRDSEGVEDITAEDLDAALLTTNSIARSLAFVTHPPLPHDREGRERDLFISQSLTVV